MTQLQHLKDDPLGRSLRGEHGDLSRRVAFRELKRRIQDKADSGIPSQVVQAALEVALEAFEELETERWAGWLCYLVEGLEKKRPAAIERVLRDVKGDIDTRLALGRW